MGKIYPRVYRMVLNRISQRLLNKIIVLSIICLTATISPAIAGNTLSMGRSTGVDQPAAQLKINLYVVSSSGNASLVDGVLNQFADRYSDAIDEYDAEKLDNFGESLSINSQDHLLVVERKQPVTRNDTIHLNMSRMKVRSYRFELIGINFDPSLNAFLVDSFSNTLIPLNINDTSRYDFNVVNVPGSWNPSRFKVLIGGALTAPLPITFSAVNAYRQNKNITIEWKAENERNVKQYEVERSADGLRFTKAITVAAKLNNGGSINYDWLDINSFQGNNYYRVRSIDLNGEVQYSAIVKVSADEAITQVTAFPNPLTGHNINLLFVNQPKGTYSVRLINGAGQAIMTKQFERSEGSNTESFRIDPTLAHGNFHLQITKPDNTRVMINVLY